MYRVNLAPEQGKRGRRGKSGKSGPASRPPAAAAVGMPRTQRSKWQVFALVAWIAAPTFIAWRHVDDGRERTNLETALDAARVDSVRYAAIHAADAALRAREDTIRRKLDVIAGLDGGRFVWAHIVDEVSRALPQHVWLTEVLFLSTDAPVHAPRFAVSGRSGSTFALTELLRALEGSPFLEDITLIQTTQVIESEARVYGFTIEAQYRTPDAAVLDFAEIFPVGGE